MTMMFLTNLSFKKHIRSLKNDNHFFSVIYEIVN